MALDESLLARPQPASAAAGARLVVPREKPKLIRASLDLRRKAVNRQKGLELVLTPEVRQRMEGVIAKATGSFEAEVLQRLGELRHLLCGLLDDDFARIFLMPQLLDLAFDIKGMAGTFGYELLTDLAKSLHDFLCQLDMPSAAEFQIVSIHIDALYLLLAHRVNGQGGEAERQLLISLGYATDKISADLKALN